MLKGVRYVLQPDPNVVIPKVDAEMTSILSTAVQEESVNQFVLTSSAAAAFIAQAGVDFEVIKGY